MYGRRVYSAREDGTYRQVEAQTPGFASSIDFLPDGTLLIAAMQEHRVLRRDPAGMLTTHADLDKRHGQLNDMVTDQDGRTWAGTVDFDLEAGGPLKPGFLERIDADGTVETVADELWYPNGSVRIAGPKLIVGESFGNRMTSFDIQPDGSLTNRSEFARFGPPPTSSDISEVIAAADVTPDGCCLDAEGAIWVADAAHNRAVRVAAGGEIVDCVDVRTPVFACTLGGAHGRTLFLCTAPDWNPHRTTRLTTSSTARRHGHRARPKGRVSKQATPAKLGDPGPQTD